MLMTDGMESDEKRMSNAEMSVMSVMAFKGTMSEQGKEK
jgi:hypothetical protein